MILVICLDGATFDLLDPWSQQGLLPNLGRLMTSGVRAVLESTNPPVTAPAWASFMTGKSPGGHGVFDYFRHDPAEITLVNSTDIRSRLFWEYLGPSEKTIGILNLPLTYPIRPINGYIASGLLSPGTRDSVYPAGLLDKYHEELGPYRLTPEILYEPGNENAFGRDLLDVTRTQIRYASRVTQDHPTDITILHFLTPDIAQHKYWQHIDPSHPWFRPDEAGRHGSTILSIFQLVDSGIGDLLEGFPGDTNVLVISDHGFGPLHRVVNLNLHLMELGYLVLKDERSTRLRRRAFQTPGINRIAERTVRWRGRRGLLDYRDIDWSRTKAYSRGHLGQIFITGRAGLTGQEYDRLLARISEDIRGLVDPETGLPIPVRLVPGRVANPGPYAHLGPDLLVAIDDYRSVAYPGFISGRKLFFEQRGVDSGHHRPEGIFIASGPAFDSGARLDQARIIDLAPTILNMSGVPVPVDMDGRVLVGAFRDSFRNAHPVEIQEPGPETDDKYEFSTEQEIALEDRLRGLGYLD